MQDKLLKLIEEIDEKGKYFGIIPIYPLSKAISNLTLTLDELKKILLEMEKKQSIYLETINDITRLSIEEKNSAIFDPIRGYLYFIGRWK
jgi:hypothetical protein